jgi:hypothetical protein
MILDVLNNFDKEYKNLTDKVDFTLDFTLSSNLLTICLPLNNFYSAVKLNYYMPFDISYYVNKTIDNIQDFAKIKTEDDFKKFLQKINKN